MSEYILVKVSTGTWKFLLHVRDKYSEFEYISHQFISNDTISLEGIEVITTVPDRIRLFHFKGSSDTRIEEVNSDVNILKTKYINLWHEKPWTSKYCYSNMNTYRK